MRIGVMKKLFVLILALCLVVSVLTACRDDFSKTSTETQTGEGNMSDTEDSMTESEAEDGEQQSAAQTFGELQPLKPLN